MEPTPPPTLPADLAIARALMLRYHEVALKGGNRGWFEAKLMDNARILLKRAWGEQGFRGRLARERNGRMLLHADPHPTTVETLRHVFGLTGFSAVRIVKSDTPTIRAAALEEFAANVRENGLPGTFRVQTRRSAKVIAELSGDLDRSLGAEIRARHPSLEVRLAAPDLCLSIEVREKDSYIWLDRHRNAGPGGLPVGTNAPALALLSGGLDSPIAALRILRRGCPVHFVHFHGAPFVGPEVLEKMEDLVRLLNRYQPAPRRLNVVPFGKIQERMALATSPKVRTILYRRMMMRIASRLAKKARLHALITGESLGQVASQTLENLSAIHAAAELPVLRPLVGHDKDEIIIEARRWGTYETSIRPGLDCCTLFADRHPAIRVTAEIVAMEEAKLPIEELVDEALSAIDARECV